MKTEIWELPDTYQDESGERFLALFRHAELVRDRRKRGLKLFLFWTAVIFGLLAIVFAKLWTMGAIAGIK